MANLEAKMSDGAMLQQVYAEFARYIGEYDVGIWLAVLVRIGIITVEERCSIQGPTDRSPADRSVALFMQVLPSHGMQTYEKFVAFLRYYNHANYAEFLSSRLPVNGPCDPSSMSCEDPSFPACGQLQQRDIEANPAIRSGSPDLHEHTSDPSARTGSTMSDRLPGRSAPKVSISKHSMVDGITLVLSVTTAIMAYLNASHSPTFRLSDCYTWAELLVFAICACIVWLLLLFYFRKFRQADMRRRWLPFHIMLAAMLPIDHLSAIWQRCSISDCGYAAILVSTRLGTGTAIFTTIATVARMIYVSACLLYHPRFLQNRANKDYFVIFITIVAMMIYPMVIIYGAISVYLSPETMAKNSGCNSFLFNLSAIVSYPVASGYGCLYYSHYIMSTNINAQQLGSTMLQSNRMTLFEPCDELFPQEFIDAFRAQQHCSLHAIASFSTSDYQPEFNVAVSFMQYPSYSACVVPFDQDAVTPEAMAEWTYEDTVNKVGTAYCGLNETLAGPCNATGGGDLSSGIPCYICGGRCYEWLEETGTKTIMDLKFKGKMVIKGKDTEMRYNSKLVVPCDSASRKRHTGIIVIAFVILMLSWIL